jgi:hypothetical protein
VKQETFSDQTLEAFAVLEARDRKFKRGLVALLVWIFCGVGLLMFLAGCGSSDAQATPVKPRTTPLTINITHLRGPEMLPYAITLSNAAQMVKEIKKATGVDAVIKRTKSIKHPKPSLQFGLSYNNRKELLYFLEDWTAKHGQCQADICLFVVPPIISNDAADYGVWYTAGVASSVCEHRGVAYAAVTEINDRGQSRVLYALVASIHEVYHLMGADHRDQPKWQPNIMDIGVLGSITFWMYEQSVKQIQRCTGRWQ